MPTPSSAPRSRIVLALLLMLAPVGGAMADPEAEYDFVYVDAFQSGYDLREAYLFDVNDHGQACGMATDLPSYAGFSWSEKAGKSRLPFTLAKGINEAGIVAGLDKVYDTGSGELVTIPHIAGLPSPPVALDLNDRGIVVGYEQTCVCSNSQRLLQVPFVWDALNGTRSIPVPGAKELLKVNESNVAVGNIRAGTREGFVHEIDTGRTILLSGFLPTNDYPANEAADVNDLGMVTGRYRGDDFSTYHGFVWTEAGGTTLLPDFEGDPSRDVWPWAINDAGVVVGTAETTEGAWHAFAWDAVRGLRDLNALAELPAGFILDRALGVNEQGWIVGDGHFGPGWNSSQAFVLVPRNIVLSAGQPALGLALRLRPHPSFGATRFEYTTADGGTARIEVFDPRGRRVAEIVEPDRPAGTHVTRWDGRDAAGRAVAPGVYVVRLALGGRVVSGKLAIVR